VALFQAFLYSISLPEGNDGNLSVGLLEAHSSTPGILICAFNVAYTQSLHRFYQSAFVKVVSVYFSHQNCGQLVVNTFKNQISHVERIFVSVMLFRKKVFQVEASVKKD